MRPANRSSACGSTGRIAANEPCAPDGLPGRFTISVAPSVPHTARLSAANGVCSKPSARIRSANPSTSRSHTSRVASGVTSRAVSPVPPVVTIKLALTECRRNAAAIKSTSSGRTSAATTVTPALSSNWRTAGPERSIWLPLEQRSLIVSTTARTSEEKVGVTVLSLRFRL